jgi:WD40 repeat protein
LANGKEVQPVVSGHDGPVWALAVSPDGNTVVSASTDDTVRLWELTTGRETQVLSVPPTKDEDGQKPYCLALSPDGRTVAAGLSDGDIQLWDAKTGKPRARFRTDGHSVLVLAYSPDGKRLVAGMDGYLFWLDATTGKELFRFAAVDLVDPETGHSPDPHAPQVPALSPNGALLAGADNDRGEVRLWETATGKLRNRVQAFPEPPPMFPHPGSEGGRTHGFRGMPRLAFSADGKILAWEIGSTVHLWDVGTGQEIGQLGGLRFSGVTAMAFAPRGHMLAVATDEGKLVLWHARTKNLLGQLRVPRGGLHSLAFAPDGKTIFTGGSDSSILVWDLERALQEWRIPPAKPTAQELDQLWNDLASSDTDRAGRAMARLQAVADPAVGVLRARLRPAKTVPDDQIVRWIADLESEEFEVRKQAGAALEKTGEQANPHLRKRLAENPPPDVRRLIEQLLEKADGFLTDLELVRLMRAIEVLEHVGSWEAREVLQNLADGAPEARLTRKAKAAIARLARH